MIIGGEQINRSICPPLPNFIDIFLQLRWNISTLTYDFFYSCDGISCFSTVTLESTQAALSELDNWLEAPAFILEGVL